jgi:hypothetical protein
MFCLRLIFLIPYDILEYDNMDDNKPLGRVASIKIAVQ